MFIHVLPRIFKFNPRAKKYRDVCCKRRFRRGFKLLIRHSFVSIRFVRCCILQFVFFITS